MAPEYRWQDFAACKAENPTIFFDPNLTDLALAICNECAVQPACLRNSINEPEGIFGGTTPEERKALQTLPDQIGEVKVIIEYY